MKLVHLEYNIELPIIENQVQVLVVENQSVFSHLVEDLTSQVKGGEGGFVLAEIDKIENISKKVEFIVNPFAVDCNERKIINKLYQELNEIALEECMEETATMNANIVTYLDMLISKVPYHLSFNEETDLGALCKIYNVEIESGNGSLLENVVSYIKVMHQICHISIFVFLNLKLFLSKEQMKMLYEFVSYEKINIILIEGFYQNCVKDEKCWLLDKDLCIIEVN